jgi:hypothetical protein
LFLKGAVGEVQEGDPEFLHLIGEFDAEAGMLLAMLKGD